MFRLIEATSRLNTEGCIYVYVYTHTHTYIYIYICVCVCVYVCVCVCVCLCVCVCVYYNVLKRTRSLILSYYIISKILLKY